MNFKALIVATVFAALGVISLVVYMKKVQVEATGGEKIEILMITKELKSGTVITDEVLGTREIPMAYVEDRMIKVADKAKVLGVKTEIALAPQQTLQWNDLSVSGQDRPGLGRLVQPGQRAFTIQIPQQYMSVHLIRPGDYVDIVGVVQEANEQSSSVLLQKILVLAVNESTAPHEQGVTNSQLLTLALTLQETQTLALALQRGPVMPALRSDMETGVTQNIPGIKMVINREARVRAPVQQTGPTGPQPLNPR